MQVNAMNGTTRLVQRAPNRSGNATWEMTPINQNSGNTSAEAADMTSTSPPIWASTLSALAANAGIDTCVTMPDSWSRIECDNVFASEYAPRTIGPPMRPSRNVSKSAVTNHTTRWPTIWVPLSKNGRRAFKSKLGIGLVLRLTHIAAARMLIPSNVPQISDQYAAPAYAIPKVATP